MTRPGVYCGKWSRFETKREAMRALALRRRSKRPKLKRDAKRVFFCQLCGGWHLGHWLSAWIG